MKPELQLPTINVPYKARLMKAEDIQTETSLYTQYWVLLEEPVLNPYPLNNGYWSVRVAPFRPILKAAKEVAELLKLDPKDEALLGKKQNIQTLWERYAKARKWFCTVIKETYGLQETPVYEKAVSILNAHRTLWVQFIEREGRTGKYLTAELCFPPKKDVLSRWDAMDDNI